MTLRLATSVLGLLLIATVAADDDAKPQSWRQTAVISAKQANQAAAADERFAYAVDNQTVAKYDRETGDFVAESRGAAKHLNSAFLHAGKLFCAHSNYPRLPEQSEIKVLDPERMELSTFKDFGNFGGSLTWAVLANDHWWCNFARYGDKNAETFLVKFDDKWKEVGRWTYPPELIKKLGTYSVSGGIWQKDALLVTDHDHGVLYEMRLPEQGSVLELNGSRAAPFTGQGIALDPKTGGLVGINRGKKQIVFAELD